MMVVNNQHQTNQQSGRVKTYLCSCEIATMSMNSLDIPALALADQHPAFNTDCYSTCWYELKPVYVSSERKWSLDNRPTEAGAYLTTMLDEDAVCEIGFLSDRLHHLNVLNLGFSRGIKHSLICWFQRKLELYSSAIHCRTLHLPTLSDIIKSSQSAQITRCRIFRIF